MTYVGGVLVGVDIELALRAMLQVHYAETDVRVDTSYPGRDRLPSISATRSGGIPDWPPVIERPRIDLNAFALTRQGAINLALETVTYLRSREGDAITFGNGVRFVLATVDETAGVLVNSDEDGIWRALTVVTLAIHQRTPMR